MRQITLQLTRGATIVLWLVFSQMDAQIRLHDAKRDAAAQEAKKTVDKIQTDDLFKKQAHNLQLLTEKDAATTIEDARVEMLSRINSFITWADVEDLLHAIKSTCTGTIPPPSIADPLKKLKTQEEALNGEIKLIRASASSSKDPSLDRVANDLGQFDSALKFARDQLALDQQAVNTTISVLDQLDSLYKAYQDQMKAIDDAKSKLQDLKIELKKALLSSLKVDEDYLLAETALHKRCRDDFKPIQQLIESYKPPPGASREERIEDTLQRLSANAPDLQIAARSLFVGAALASRGKLPERLYRVRSAELDHLHSIQSSAANARIYETILGGGVERLALFYQGGIKPETLAQIIQSLSTTGIFGKIVTQ